MDEDLIAARVAAARARPGEYIEVCLYNGEAAASECLGAMIHDSPDVEWVVFTGGPRAVLVVRA